MQCYECAKRGVTAEAVAACWSCSAGLCLTHVREAAAVMRTGAIRVSCHHDTWTAVPARGRRSVSRQGASA
jgi:hypothetical protein